MPQPVPSQNFQLQPRVGLGLGLGLGQGIQNAIGTAFGSGLELMKEAINPDPRLETMRLANDEARRTAISRQVSQGVTDPKQLAQMFDMDEEEASVYLNNPTLQNMAKDAQHASRLRARWENRDNSPLPSEDPNPLSESDRQKLERGNLKRSGVLNGAAQMTKGYQSQQGTGGVTDSLIGGQDQVDATGSEHSPTADFVSASDPAEMARSVLAPDSPEFKAEQDRIRKHLAAAPQRLNEAIRNETMYRSFLLEQYRQEQERNSDVYTAHFSNQYMPRNNMDSYRDRTVAAMDQAMWKEYIEAKTASMGILPDVIDKVPLGDLSVYLDNSQTGKIDAMKLLAANYESSGSPDGMKAAKELRLQIADLESRNANAQSVLAGMSTRDQIAVLTALKSVAPLLAQSPGKSNLLNTVASVSIKSIEKDQDREQKRELEHYKGQNRLEVVDAQEKGKANRQEKSLEFKKEVEKGRQSLGQQRLEFDKAKQQSKENLARETMLARKQRWEKEDAFKANSQKQMDRRLDLLEKHYSQIGDKNQLNAFKQLKDLSSSTSKALTAAWRDYDSKRKDAEKLINPDPLILRQVNEAKRRYEELFSKWNEIDTRMKSFLGESDTEPSP